MSFVVYESACICIHTIKKQKFEICLDRDTEGKGTRKSSTIKNDGTSCSTNWVFFFLYFCYGTHLHTEMVYMELEIF